MGFTPESMAKGRAKWQSLTPEERSRIVRKSGYTKWYKTGEPADTRLACELRFLARIAGVLANEGKLAEAVRTVIAMGRFEHIRIGLELRRQGESPVLALPDHTKVAPPIDVTNMTTEDLEKIVQEAQDTARKLARPLRED